MILNKFTLVQEKKKKKQIQNYFFFLLIFLSINCINKLRLNVTVSILSNINLIYICEFLGIYKNFFFLPKDLSCNKLNNPQFYFISKKLLRKK